MNGGRNYNGPKVAKFLVRSVLTRTNGVTIWALSLREARRNWIIREDTDYVYQDRKTLLSFTVA